MVLADLGLARRIESAEAENARATVGGQPAVLDVAGGCAVFVGAESPLTQAVGLGLSGRVREDEIRSMEEFFQERGANVSLELCPLANAGFVESLSTRGYRVTQFNNVLVRKLAELGECPSPRVRRAGPEEREMWSRAVGRGFFEQGELTEAEMDVGRAIFNMPGGFCYFSSTEGEVAGGAGMSNHGGLALFFADATIARFRRAGLHSELIAARLADAAAQGCDLASASTLPGSGSQRNFERAGFQVVYTRVTLVKNF